MERPTCQKCGRRECERKNPVGWYSQRHIDCLQAQIDALKAEVEMLQQVEVDNSVGDANSLPKRN